MKRRLIILTAALALFSLLMAACGAPSTSIQPQPTGSGAWSGKAPRLPNGGAGARRMAVGSLPRYRLASMALDRSGALCEAPSANQL